jgi:hypothetical protein
VAKTRKNRQQTRREPNTVPIITPAAIGICVWVIGTFVYVLKYLSAHPSVSQFQEMWFSPEYFWSYWWNGRGVSFGFLDRAPVLIMATLFLAGCWILGSAVLKSLKVEQHLNKWESISLATTIGLHFAGLYTLLMGLAGLLNRLVFCLPLTLIVATAAWFCFRHREAISAAATGSNVAAGEDNPAADNNVDEVDRARWYRIAIGAAIPFLIAYVLGGMNPPRDFDVREYHLQAPKEWYQAGQITFLKHNVYASMPMSAEMPALANMAIWPGSDSWWWGAIVGKTLIASYAILTWLLLLGAGQRLGSPLAGAFAGLVYITIPMVGIVSLAGLIDAALAHFTLAALYTTWRWHKSPQRNRRSWLILAGISAGAAISCKYPAVVMLLIPLAIFFAVQKWRESLDDQSDESTWRSAALVAVAYIGIAVASSAPWFLKNAIATGNPTYPLVRSVVPSVDSLQLVARWDRAHRTPADNNGSVYSLAQFIGAITDIVITNRQQSMVLWPLVVVGMLGWKRREFLLWFGGYALMFVVLWWLFTHRIDRFWLPILPPLALIAGTAIDTWQVRGWRIIVSILLLGYAMMLVPLACFLWGDVRIFASLTELREDTQTEFLAPRVNPVHRFLNENKASVGKVLLVGDAQPFDLEVPAIYNTCFNECEFELIARDSTELHLKEELQEKGITHIFVYWGELNRYRSPGNYGFSDFATPELMARLEKSGAIKRISVPDLEPQQGDLFKIQD